MGIENARHAEYTTKYLASFGKLPKEIQVRARQKEKLFLADPFAPPLKTHKLHGAFSAYGS